MFRWAIFYATVFFVLCGFIVFGFTATAQVTPVAYYDALLIAGILCAFTALVHWFLYQITLAAKTPKKTMPRRKTILEQLLSDRQAQLWSSWTPTLDKPIEAAKETPVKGKETLH